MRGWQLRLPTPSTPWIRDCPTARLTLPLNTETCKHSHPRSVSTGGRVESRDYPAPKGRCRLAQGSRLAEVNKWHQLGQLPQTCPAVLGWSLLSNQGVVTGIGPQGSLLGQGEPRR
eukprot:761821-Hanusia_phi.AAC.1